MTRAAKIAINPLEALLLLTAVTILLIYLTFVSQPRRAPVEQVTTIGECRPGQDPYRDLCYDPDLPSE